jgi:tetratricopeptide (TPR) repeat protein
MLPETPAYELKQVLQMAALVSASPCEHALRSFHCYARPWAIWTLYVPSQLWASFQHQLGICLAQNPFGNRAQNLEDAIVAFQEALKLFTRKAYPKEWSDIHSDLGLVFFHRIHGDRENNLAEAIHHCEISFEVRTYSSNPEAWSDTQDNLGIAYVYYTAGNWADNIEKAIYHFEQALMFRTQARTPEKWADTQNNLAGAYFHRIRGDRAENLEFALEHNHNALKVRTPQSSPLKWAMTQDNLAAVYSERIRGKRAENLERAIEHSQQALSVYTRDIAPEGWAKVHNTLGNAYRERISGERAENIETAILHYRQAQEVYTDSAFPEKSAIIHTNLGESFLNRIHGNRSENIEQAIQYFDKALAFRTQTTLPEQWAETQANLGQAYYHRIQGNRIDNLETAMALCRQAQEIITREKQPREWATLLLNLSAIYQDRIRGERHENLVNAIACCQQALEIFTQQDDPRLWAAVHNNLGNTYQALFHGNRAENLEKAIHHLEQALLIRTREDLPDAWAQTQNNLGCVYLDRLQGEVDDNLQRAIEHLEHALSVYDRGVHPEMWANVTSNLGIAYAGLAELDPAVGFEQAIHFYDLALQVLTRQAYPFRWASIQHNLGDTYRKSRAEDQRLRISAAVEHYSQALEVRTPEAFPLECRESAYWLGKLLYDEKNFHQARVHLAAAAQAVEMMHSEAHREEARRVLAEENADLYAHLVACCLLGNDIDTAFEYAAAAKGRAFIDMLAKAQIDLSQAGNEDPQLADFLERARSLGERIDALRFILSDKTSGSGTDGSVEQRIAHHNAIQTELTDTQRQYENCWKLLAYRFPALTSAQHTPSLKADEALSLAAKLGATLVEYFQHEMGWCAFMISPTGIQHIPLPGLNGELIQKMLGWVRGVEFAIGRGQLSLKQLEEWYCAVITPLTAFLKVDEKVILAPFGALHLLPLGAARNPQARCYAIDEYEISYAPSLSALKAALDQFQLKAVPDSGQRLLSVAYPGAPDSSHYLPNILKEAQVISGHFTRVSALHNEAATADTVLALAPGHNVIHFGCHGWFDTIFPEQSGLMLAGGWLTVQRILTELHLSPGSLVSMAACVSGLARVRLGEEYTGLTQSMLTAGAQSVLSSLWPVDDAATRAMFEYFYEGISHGESSAQALRRAAQRVAGQRGWEHPYYWAGFIASGLSQ